MNRRVVSVGRRSKRLVTLSAAEEKAELAQQEDDRRNMEAKDEVARKRARLNVLRDEIVAAAGAADQAIVDEFRSLRAELGE